MTPDLPTLIRTAQAQLRAGQADAAAASFAQVVAADPRQADAWFNLAWLHRSGRRFAAALDAYARAIAAGVARPEEAHLNRAAILADHLFRPDSAVAELRLALALDPHFLPAWLNLGSIAEDQGDAAAARDAYEAVVRLEPGNGRARARLAALDLIVGRAGEAAAALKASLPLAATPDDQADMLFALGNALDAQRAYGDAWPAFEAGNWIARSLAATPHDPAAHAALIDRLIAAFPQPPTLLPAEAGPTPVFVCGMFRSGSTLAEQILGRHPLVAARGELETVPALAGSLRPYPEALAGLDADAWRELRERYREELGALPPGARAWTDKRCDNYLHIGLIKAMFPTARIVETVRQPLDNLLSAWFLRFGEGVTHAHDLAAAAHHYVEYRRLMAHWRALWPDSIHRFDYDRAVAAPREAVAALLADLGLPWDEACLTPERGAGPVRTASAWAVRQPLHTRSSGRWRHYAEHLDGVRAILAAAGL